MTTTRAVENGMVFSPEVVEPLHQNRSALKEIRAVCEGSRRTIEQSRKLLREVEQRMARRALDQSEAAE